MSAIELDLLDVGTRAAFHAGQLKVCGFQVDVPCAMLTDRWYHIVTLDVPRGHSQAACVAAIHIHGTVWPATRYNVRVEIAGAPVSDEFRWDERTRQPDGSTRYILKAVHRRG